MPEFAAYVRRLVTETGRGLEPDADALLTRFANPAIAHRLDQIAMDGDHKLPQRLVAPAMGDYHIGPGSAAIGRAGRSALLAVPRSYRAYAQAHPGRYAASLRAQPDDPEINDLGAQIVSLLIQLLAAYALSESDALHAVRGLRSIVHGFVSLEAVGAFKLALDLDESFDRLVSAFIDGLDQQRSIEQ